MQDVYAAEYQEALDAVKIAAERKVMLKELEKAEGGDVNQQKTPMNREERRAHNRKNGRLSNGTSKRR